MIRMFAVILLCLFSFSVITYFILSLPNSITLFYSMYRIVRGLSRVVDSVPKTRAVKTMEPILRKEVSLPSVRFFATSSKKLETIVASSRKGRAGAFFGGTAVTLGVCRTVWIPQRSEEFKRHAGTAIAYGGDPKELSEHAILSSRYGELSVT